VLGIENFSENSALCLRDCGARESRSSRMRFVSSTLSIFVMFTSRSSRDTCDHRSGEITDCPSRLYRHAAVPSFIINHLYHSIIPALRTFCLSDTLSSFAKSFCRAGYARVGDTSEFVRSFLHLHKISLRIFHKFFMDTC